MTTRQPEALIPDEKTVMAQAQVYASTWAIVGSRFDAGDGLELAEQEKTILADMVRRLGARITELESQLAQRFDAADVATASAQGFRDGVASEASPPALASDPAQHATDERRLRRHLCATFEHLPYMDDGEAQGQSLDWLRCTVDQIDAKIREVRLERLASATAQPVAEPAKSADMSDEREAFEAWLRSVWTAGYGCQKCDSGKYVHDEAQRFWECWQASAAHGQAPAPTHEQIAAYLESTGAYVTNDATREAAIAEAIDTDRAKRGQAPDLHPKTSDLVQRFAAALAEKLSAAEKKYGYSDGWASPNWMDECRQHLSAHIAKGDPRDVAAYCAFLWHHGATTASPQAEQQAPTGPEIYVCARKCYNCGHAGINDDHADNAACKSCDWSGPSPEKDHCPDCEKDGTMTAACPMCSCAYIMVADTQVAAPAALNAPQAADMATASAQGFRDGVASVSRLTDQQIASACMSYRHDFGLLDDANKAQLVDDARSWEYAFAKEREWAAADGESNELC